MNGTPLRPTLRQCYVRQTRACSALLVSVRCSLAPVVFRVFVLDSDRQFGSWFEVRQRDVIGLCMAIYFTEDLFSWL